MVVIDTLVGDIGYAYSRFLDTLPGNFKLIPPLFFIAITIALYSIFIWFFYRFLAKRDVLKINLERYNQYQHAGVLKFFSILFYILKFMIIAPIVIFFWFAILTIFMIVLAKELEVGTVVMICAALISAIRITSYFRRDLSKDLAKMVPFTLLGVAILTPGFIDIGTSISRMSQIPSFFDNAIYYFLFIVALEVILRLFCLMGLLVDSTKSEWETNQEET
jgi:hypothetical protein